MPIPQNPLVVSAFNGGPFVSAGLSPIIAKRAPTINDKYQIGQTWIYPATNSAWVLTSIVANVATWSDLTGAAGVFTSLTVTPGPTSLTGSFTVIAGTNTVHLADDAADHTFIAGSGTGTSAMTLNSGTGGIGLTPAATGNINLNASTTGTITLGTANEIGAIFVGISTSGQAISIGGAVNTGAQSISLGSGTSGANSTVNILTGNATAGIQTLNALTGTRAGAANIATGAAANTTIIGTVTAGSSVTLRTPATGVVITTGTGNTANITCGTGDPNTVVTAPQGSLYLRLDGSSAATRAYINSNGATTWVAVTTAS